MINLPRRIAGVLLLGTAVLMYDAASASAIHRLLLPIMMAFAAWLLVQNAAAVLLGVMLLAAIHANPGAPDWIAGRAYPLLALVSAGGLGFIAVQRFRRRIEETREARWRHRRP